MGRGSKPVCRSASDPSIGAMDQRRVARHPRQHHLERVGGPGLGDEIVVFHLVADVEEHVDARHQVRREVAGEADAALGELFLEFQVLRLHQRPVGADEECFRPLAKPVEIFVVVAVQGIEQQRAADAFGGAADRQHERQRMVAAAIGRDHDRRPLEHRACPRIAMQARELVRRLAHELREHARLPEPAGAGIGGIDGKLRRHQHGVEPGLDDLPRHLLAVAHVAGERRAVAVEVHHDQRRLAEIEAARDRHQHAAIAVGRVLPEHAATRRAPAPLALGDIQKRLSGSRRDAVEGEWRDVERHQRGARRRDRPLRERRRGH